MRSLLLLFLLAGCTPPPKHDEPPLTATRAQGAYQLTPPPLLPDSKFVLCRSTLGREMALHAYHTTPKGQLLRDVAPRGLPIQLEDERWWHHNLYPGQEVTYILRSADGKRVCGTTIVPYPLEMHAADGATIALTPRSRAMRDFTCTLTGFQPAEILSYEIEEKKGSFAADGSGCYRLPLQLGRRGGTATLTVKRATEVVTMRFAWGQAAAPVSCAESGPHQGVQLG